MKLHVLLLAGSVVCLSGCQTYTYRVIQPPGITQPIADQAVIIRREPLEYRLMGDHNHLFMRINNPTDDRLILLGDRSYVVDPMGESHPVRPQVLGPHSFTRMFLPPVPITFAYTDWSWGWPYGWGWGPYDPFWGPYWGPAYYGPPPLRYKQVTTQYDWTWKTGPARLHLTYDRNQTIFEHDFEIIRELAK